MIRFMDIRRIRELLSGKSIIMQIDLAGRPGLFGPNPPECAGKQPTATGPDVIVI